MEVKNSSIAGENLPIMSISGSIARQRFFNRALTKGTTGCEIGDSPRNHSPISEEDFVLLQQRCNQQKQEIAQIKDALLRARADYDNLKRRTHQEKTQFRDLGKEEVFSALLDTLDNFDRAVEASKAHQEIESIREGILMVQTLMMKTLGDLGLQKMQAGGSKFDPNIHEAIGTEPREDLEENTISTVIAAGYKLGDKVIRPARVLVAKKPAPAG
jgi:molecular chaperone GrpE